MPINLETSEYTARFNCVFLPEERAKLQKLAEVEGLKESALIRKWINEEYEVQFGSKKPGEPQPKYNSAKARAKTRKK